MAEQKQLYTGRADGKKLSETVSEFIKAFGAGDLPETFAVLYSPSSCYLARVVNEEFHDERGQINDDAIFEARVFNSAAEMRWLNNASGIGVAAILTETANFIFFDKEAALVEEIVETHPQTYLTWGEAMKDSVAPDGWTQFAEARIGMFYVPITTKRRAWFTALEYWKKYKFGNVGVFDERLTGIKSYPEDNKNEQSNN